MSILHICWCVCVCLCSFYIFLLQSRIYIPHHSWLMSSCDQETLERKGDWQSLDPSRWQKAEWMGSSLGNYQPSPWINPSRKGATCTLCRSPTPRCIALKNWLGIKLGKLTRRVFQDVCDTRNRQGHACWIRSMGNSALEISPASPLGRLLIARNGRKLSRRRRKRTVHSDSVGSGQSYQLRTKWITE